MAIEITSITKRDNGTYNVTVQDTANQIRVDDKNNPIYQTYSSVHNPKDSADIIKQRIINQIAEHKKLKSNEDTVLTNIKTAIESINVATIAVAK